MDATALATKIIKQVVHGDPMKRQQLIVEVAKELEAWKNEANDA